MSFLLPNSVGYDVTQVSSLPVLLNTMSVANKQVDPDTGGIVWGLKANSERFPVFFVGVRGILGSLTWSLSPHRSYVPTTGINTEHEDYHDVFGYDAPQLPRSEVRINVVYKAVEEFFSAHSQPSCIEWTLSS